MTHLLFSQVPTTHPSLPTLWEQGPEQTEPGAHQPPLHRHQTETAGGIETEGEEFRSQIRIKQEVEAKGESCNNQFSENDM